MKTSVLGSGLGLFLFYSSSAFAGSLAVKSGDITFIAKATPGFLTIEGTKGKVTGQLQKNGTKITGELRTKLDDFTTGMDLRDSHMKEKYVETAKYPEAVLKLTSFEVNDKGEANEGTPFKGSLLFHGVEKPVEGTASVVKDGSGYKITADFAISLKNFNFEVPNYKVVKVKDEINLHSVVIVEEAAATAGGATPSTGKAAPK